MTSVLILTRMGEDIKSRMPLFPMIGDGDTTFKRRMRPKLVAASVNRELASMYTTHKYSSGCEDASRDSHGGELSPEHVVYLLTTLIPTVIWDNVDTVIDMGCGGGNVLAAAASLNPELRVVGVDCSFGRLCRARILTERLGLSNVDLHHCDWNRDNPLDEKWAFLDRPGQTLLICNNFNFSLGFTQENLEKLVTSRCRSGTYVLSYSTAFAARGNAVELEWLCEENFPADHFSWATQNKLVQLTIHKLLGNTINNKHHHSKRIKRNY